MADRKHVSREEEFRDYEARDTRDGWPYPDDDDARRPTQNSPYGARDAALDQRGDDGFAITRDPVDRDVDGAPLPFADEMDDIIADDDLEARIIEALKENGKIDIETLNLTIREGVAVLDGAVDSEEERGYLIAFLRRVKGVRDVQAEKLLSRGVDSHIPRDATE